MFLKYKIIEQRRIGIIVEGSFNSAESLEQVYRLKEEGCENW